MRLVEMPVLGLKPGMFVAELDRPRIRRVTCDRGMNTEFRLEQRMKRMDTVQHQWVMS